MMSVIIVLFLFVCLQLITGISGLTIVTRAQWGARPPTSTSSLTIPVGKVYIHHTATPQCSDLSACSSRVRSIQNHHMDTNNYVDIGYSFLIGQDGQVYEGRGWDKVGAHTAGQNSDSIGIAIIGDFSSVIPNCQAQLAAHELLASGVRQGNLTSTYKLYGHRQAVATVCPGNSLYNLITTWEHYQPTTTTTISAQTSPPLTIVSRSEWGARAPRSSSTISDDINRVFIHHTVTGECNSLATCSSTLRGIQNYHMDTRGWSDIGYSFLIGQDGQVYEGRGWNKAGAHTYGHNSVSYGIAFIGTFTSKQPNTESVNAAMGLLEDGVGKGKINSNYELYGHRQVSQTACPGDSLYSLIQTWPHYASGQP